MKIKDIVIVDITELGGLGDGIGWLGQQRYIVTATIPGDRVEIEIERISREAIYGRILRLLSPSSQRQQPPCVYAETCGGCQLQHMQSAYYRQSKERMTSQIIKALKLEKEEHILQPILEVGERGRRRATFHVQLYKGDIRLGYAGFQSHQITDIADCLICEPAIAATLPALRNILTCMKKPSMLQAIELTHADNGLDVRLVLNAPLKEADRLLWQEKAAQSGWLRLASTPADERQQVQGRTDVMYLHEVPFVRLGTYEVELPANAFLQASHKAQLMMTQWMKEHLGEVSHLADFYAGCGTFSFPMLTQARLITAYEGAADMVAAAHNTIRRYGLEAVMDVQVSDLYRYPVQADRLSHMDAAIINPPRNGALPQVKEIAASTIQKLVMVSCNPATFQRDAAWLLNAGFSLISLLPIDQFTWSKHLEMIAYFERV